MRNNKEFVHAHNFVRRRLVRAVVFGDPDGWEQPLRRSTVGMVIGMILAVVLVLGFLVYGFLRPGKGPGLRPETTFVIEKETGARFLVDQGVLRPVPNRASALLVAGPELVPQTLTRARTAMLPRGRAIGIVGAPDNVPAAAAAVVKGGWAACTDASVATSGTVGPLFVELAPLRPVSPVEPGTAFVVATPDGVTYLVVDGVSHAFGSGTARNALGFGAVPPLRVSNAWLSALRPGRALDELPVEGVGEQGPVVAGKRTTVGQVLVVRAGGDSQYYLVTRDGIVAVSQSERLVLLGTPKVAAANGPDGAATLVPASAVAEATRARLPDAQGWPTSPPRAVQPSGQQVCVAGDGRGAVSLGTRAAQPTTVTASGSVRVGIPPGAGVVAEAVDPAGGGVGPVSLVDDLGVRYPVADARALKALGLEAAARMRVPSGLLEAMPAGPALDVKELQEWPTDESAVEPAETPAPTPVASADPG